MSAKKFGKTTFKPSELAYSKMPDDFNEFIAWSDKTTFGVDARLIDELTCTLGESGLELARKIFEVSKNYKYLAYPDYAKLLHVTESLIESKSIDSLFEAPKDIQPDLLNSLWRIGSSNFRGYIESLKLVNYSEYFLVTNKENLKTLMNIIQGHHRRFSSEKASKAFKTFIDSIVDVSHINSDLVISALYILRNVYDEKTVIEICKKLKSENYDFALFTIVALAKDWGNLKDEPLEWALALTVGDDR